MTEQRSNYPTQANTNSKDGAAKLNLAAAELGVTRRADYTTVSRDGERFNLRVRRPRSKLDSAHVVHARAHGFASAKLAGPSVGIKPGQQRLDQP